LPLLLPLLRPLLQPRPFQPQSWPSPQPLPFLLLQPRVSKKISCEQWNKIFTCKQGFYIIVDFDKNLYLREISQFFTHPLPFSNLNNLSKIIALRSTYFVETFENYYSNQVTIAGGKKVV
jgi:hypothetical protein